MRDWIKKLIQNFRDGYQKLSELEKTKIGNLDNLVSPLQVEIIIIQNKSLGLQNQIFIFTHFTDEPDLDIKVHEIDSNGAIEKVQEILKDAKWQKKLPEDSSWNIKDESKKIFATIIEGSLIDSLRRFKKDVMNVVFSEYRQSQALIGTKTFITKDSFVWQGVGDIQKLEVKEIAAKIIEDAKNSAKPQPQPIQAPQPPRIKGFGTYFYPAIYVGKRPEPSFKDRVIEPEIPLFPKKAFDAEYKGHKVVVNNNGFIAIGIDDRNKALRMLNEIMATSLFFNLPFYAIRDSELGDADIDPATLQVGGRTMSMYASLRTALFEEEIMLKPKIDGISMPRGSREIQQEQLIEIIKQAEILTKEDIVSEFLVYLLESYTYFQNSEYNQSFIMSWIIIEKYLSFRWRELLQEKGIKGKQIENLDIDMILKTMYQSELITDEQFKLYMKMKEIRNDFVHEGKSISKENAQKCFKVGSSVVDFLVNIYFKKS